MIFVCSMSDLFHEDVPDEFILRVFDVIAMTPQHTYQILTKRPLSMLDWYEKMTRLGYLAVQKPNGRICDNAWLGVSVENQEQFDSRWYWASQIPAAGLVVSCEPLLGSIRFDARAWEHLPDWVICGGESGPGARPMHPDWARSLRDQCQAAGVPYFFKQWGAWVPFSQGQGHAISEHTTKCWLDVRGQPGHSTYSAMMHEPSALFRVGKKRAGHLLDGRTWDEMPKEAICS
jgi:protein gp37